MPLAFSAATPKLDWDPTNHPMYNPADMAQGSADIWVSILEGIVNLIPGANQIVALIKDLTGVDLLSFERVFAGIDLNDPGAMLGAIENVVAQLGTGLVAQLLSLLTGGASNTGTGSGSSSTDVLGGLLGQILAIPGDIWSLLFGSNASQQAQLNALQSGGFSYDPAINDFTGWNALVGSLGLSARGKYIQAAARTVWYRASGIASDKYGASFVIDPTMRGVSGVGICADSAGASWVGLLAYRGFDGDALWLVTAASPILWVVQKQVDLIGVNRLAGLTTLDLKTDGVNKFSTTLNGKPVTALDWTDTGGIATHNSTHRGVILLSNGLNRSEDSYYGPAFKGKVVTYAA